ncbi:unnamed protein product [Phytomonas sp. Hart1]|nr:unnamed protein product [Phytomonas sp. Hart1]|eukprot:CCW72071.1 unnamed protein product [Phytomonas sp. isolate Hart1]
MTTECNGHKLGPVKYKSPIQQANNETDQTADTNNIPNQTTITEPDTRSVPNTIIEISIKLSSNPNSIDLNDTSPDSSSDQGYTDSSDNQNNFINDSTSSISGDPTTESDHEHH